MEWRDLGQVKGDTRKDGVGLEFIWNGTKLGVKKETDYEYQFVDLQGQSNINESQLQDLLEGLESKNLIELVDTLPETGEENVIYLRARTNSNSTSLYALKAGLDDVKTVLSQILEKIDDNSLLNTIQVVDTLPETGLKNTLYFVTDKED